MPCQTVPSSYLLTPEQPDSLFFSSGVEIKASLNYHLHLQLTQPFIFIVVRVFFKVKMLITWLKVLS